MKSSSKSMLRVAGASRELEPAVRQAPAADLAGLGPWSCVLLGRWIAFPAFLALAWTSFPTLAATQDGSAHTPLHGTARLAELASPTDVSAETSGPRLSMESLTVDFGTVQQHQTVDREFPVRNSGDQVLCITDVRSDCGCVKVVAWPARLEAGKTGRITLRLQTLAMSGTLKKTIAIDSNDPTNPHRQLQIRADVWVPIQIEPPAASFRKLRHVRTKAIRRIRLLNRMEHPVEIRNPRSRNSAFKAELETVRPGWEYALEVHTVPPLKLGPIIGTVTVDTSAEEIPTVRVRAFAYVLPPVEVSPKQLILSAGTLDADRTCQLRVSSNDGASFRLLPPRIHLRGLRVRVKPTAPGEQAVVEVVFPKGMTLRKPAHPVVTIRTDHPQAPRIAVSLLLAPDRPAQP